ncbi:energy transducer TonB [Novosphingobium pentaromativorans]|uniref:TonB-like protein n=1 Tax=Novosphingobium pentaromativorans US6-1 TaxID=1088721 RepID=G6EIQ8_9SPHN|nr:TonB family protein [Novosphingobium pentaromativorans]AIT78874.1 energy transducer TonB [Novosphingobium pentaromativorans US6-1]EHJ59000.1 TonB-like protein [Novosphingobium pentaromativorans US6-1]
MKNIVLKAAAVASVLAMTAAPAMADDWLNTVKRSVASKQTYPRTAQMRGEEGTAKVKVYVSSSGKVERTELVATSGSSALDREAEAVFSRMGNLPAPPSGTSSVVLPLTWKLL